MAAPNLPDARDVFTHSVTVSGRYRLGALLRRLLDHREMFAVEPTTTGEFYRLHVAQSSARRVQSVSVTSDEPTKDPDDPFVVDLLDFIDHDVVLHLRGGQAIEGVLVGASAVDVTVEMRDGALWRARPQAVDAYWFRPVGNSN